MRAAAVVVIAGTSAVAGLGVDWLLARSQGASAAPSLAAIVERLDRIEAERHESSRIACSASVDPTLLRAELERALAKPGLMGANAGAVTATEATGEPARPAAPRAEAHADEEARAQRLVDDALASGQWRADAATALRELMPALAPERRQQLLSSLAAAINRGQIKPDPSVPLL